MARFCASCGAPQQDGVKFCASCGSQIVEPVSPPPPQMNPQPYMPPPQVVVVNPSIPGRGMGITSMVLGIIAQFYGAILIVIALQEVQWRKEYAWLEPESVAEFAPLFIMVLILAILGISFSAAARNKNYRNGISASGMVLSILSMICIIISFVILQS